jgi:exosome complex component RRP40
MTSIASLSASGPVALTLSAATANMSDHNQLIIVLPGDDVTEKIKHNTTTAATAIHQNNKKATTRTPKLGIGLRYEEGTDRVFATIAGRLVHKRSSGSNTYYVQQNISRYRPVQEDRVIGIIEERVASDGTGGDIYRVNIGGPHPGQLSNLSFEGATKRNKPNLTTGTLLYCRIQSTPPSMDPILSCQVGPHDGGIPRKDWMTNEGTYGELRGGTCRRIPLGLARELLYPDNLVLTELSKSIAYEIGVGVNGMLWVHSPRPEYTIMILNAIMNSQVLTTSQVRGMVKALVETVNRQIEEDDEDD